MNVQNRKLSELTPYLGNAKKHDKKQIDNVAESIRQYGFVQPIVVDRDAEQLSLLVNSVIGFVI